MAWKISIGKVQPPQPHDVRLSGIIMAGAGILIYLGLHAPHQPNAGLTAHAGRINQPSSADVFDLAAPSMKPLSSPGPRHRVQALESYNIPPLPYVTSDSLVSDPLRTETLRMQRRLQTFRAQWKDAQSAAREKFFLGALPVQDLEAEQRTVNQRFAAAYAGQFASEALAVRRKLLQAVPGLSSHQDYERAQTVQQLVDIERDFAELTTAYLRK